jgi:hypothetical protein
MYAYGEDGRNGESLPSWYVNHPTLRSDDTPEGQRPDVVVVGAGIAGLSVAYHRTHCQWSWSVTPITSQAGAPARTCQFAGDKGPAATVPSS